MLLPVFSFGRVNYEDPNYSVGLPVFSIHGNHDDPAREGTMDVSTRGQAARWIACRMDRWSPPSGCCDGGSCVVGVGGRARWCGCVSRCRPWTC